jgi:hypothetical protein
MWNRNSLLLQSASGIAKPTSNAGIVLTERHAGRQKQDAADCQTLREPSSLFHGCLRVFVGHLVGKLPISQRILNETTSDQLKRWIRASYAVF